MIKVFAIYLAMVKTYAPAAIALGVAYIAWRISRNKRCRAAAELREQRREEHELDVQASGETVKRERWARSINEWNKGHNMKNALLAGAACIDQMRQAK